MGTTVKHVKIPAGQTMVSSVQVMAPAKPTDVNAIHFFKVKHVMPALINTTMTPIAPPVIKATAYYTNARHAPAVEIHLRPVKSASTATLKILITIALYWGAPSAKKIILDLHQIH